MLEHLEKLRAQLIKDLLKDKEGCDKPYVFTHGEKYTKRELAHEIEINSDTGIDILKNMIMLTLDLLSRNKIQS